ncbi:MAG: PAS domain-containing protein [Spirochaetia bacterium]|nr:PAS domain-containing protein [Spirochaetia bacterium]
MNTDFYKKLLERSPFGYAYHQIVTDADGSPVDYIFLEVNSEFERLTGLSRRDILNKSVSQVLPPLREGEFDWVKYYGEVAQNGESRTFEQYSAPQERYYKVDAYSPQKGYFVTIFSDITATKQLQEDFRKTSDFLETVLQSIRDGIIVLETDLTIRHVNRRMEEWYGPADSLIGKKCYQVFRNKTSMCKDCPVERVMESKQPASSIVDWGPAQGIEWVESYGYPMFDKESGEVTGVIEVIRDITEQKQAAEAVAEANWHLEEQTVIAREMAAQAEMASQAKSDFLAEYEP